MTGDQQTKNGSGIKKKCFQQSNDLYIYKKTHATGYCFSLVTINVCGLPSYGLHLHIFSALQGVN